MKVVLFCGGLGMRIREFSESIPKPMVPIGSRPILWHVMKYYAHFGHKDFILCLGWKGDAIKDYFLNYNECMTNDFVLSSGGHNISLLSSDIDDWKITFVNTGRTAMIGERLKAVESYVKDEEVFLANYTDGLSDIQLPDLIDVHHRNQATATFISVRPSQSFHCVDSDSTGCVHSVKAITDSNIWMNGGFFVLSNQIFDYLGDGEELVTDAFPRLIPHGALCTLQHHGFWSCMDTYKEKQTLDEMEERGNAPWQLWENAPRNPKEGIRSGQSSRVLATRPR